jgi:hypothetical protein
MHKTTKNDLYKYYSNNNNELNNISQQIYNIDKSLLYNEMEINVMYIIDNNGRKSNDVHNINFIKFLKNLTMQEEDNYLIKVNEQREFIYRDNFNVTKYILNDKNQKSNTNYQICLIFNNTLENKNINNNSLITNIDVINNSDKIYLFIFIIPISDEFWKIEFKINSKKKDEFANKLKEIIEEHFLNCYILSVRNDFSFIVYYFKIIFSLLQDLMCIIKNDIKDKKLLTKLNGIKHEEILNRMNIFKSINF